MILETLPSSATIPIELIRRFQTSVPVDVKALAEGLGLRVYETDGPPLRPAASGMILKNAVTGGSSGYCIVLRSTDPFNRKRFTLAHEIAHFLLHRDAIGEALSDDAMYRSGLPTLQEAEANQLAAEILMPADMIRKYIRILGGVNSSALAKSFRVSESAMQIRLDNM